MVLFLTVLGLLIGILLPTFRVYLFSRSRLDVRQSAIQSLHRLCTEIQNTVPESITLCQAPAPGVPVALSLVELEDFSVTGTFRWHNGFELFYFDKTQEKLLWKRIRPSGYDFTQPAPPALLPADLTTQLTATPLEQRVVALYVHKVTIEHDSPSSFPLKIGIDSRIEESSDPARRGKTEIFHLEAQVAPRSKRW